MLHGGHRHGRQEFHPVATRLGDEPVGQFRTRDPVGEPRVVIDAVADPGLAAEGTGIDDDGIDAFPSGIDGGRQPGRSTPNDDEVICGPIGLDSQADATGQGLVARVHLVSPVPKVDQGDDLPATLQLLEALDRLGLLFDVDVVIGDPVGGEELLHSLAMGAPRGPVDGDRRVVSRGHRPTLG